VRCPRETSGGERLAPEARAYLLLPRVALGEELDGDLPLENGVGRAVHLAHPAAGDERSRRISLGERVVGDSPK
jgi:hypothetical protein